MPAALAVLPDAPAPHGNQAAHGRPQRSRPTPVTRKPSPAATCRATPERSAARQRDSGGRRRGGSPAGRALNGPSSAAGRSGGGGGGGGSAGAGRSKSGSTRSAG